MQASDSWRVPQSERLPVVFIAGFGRSGSTLLGRMLAELPGWLTVGELGQIWDRGFTQNVRCGCGVPFRACPFWIEVIARAGLSTLSDAELELLRSYWKWRSRPVFLCEVLQSSAYRYVRDLYVARTGQVLRAVQKMQQCRVIVDTSKTPAQLVALSMLPDIDLHVVHLVRDSRGVAHSWQRPHHNTDIPWPPSHPFKSAVLWTGTNLLTSLVRKRARTFVRIRYEDFIARPEETINGIACTALGSGNLAAREAFASRIDLTVHHTVAGNPMRFHSGPTDLCEDRTWQDEMPPAMRRCVSAITWPLRRVYGY